MSEKITYITQHGLTKLEDELNYLKTVKRKEIAEVLKETVVNIEDPDFLITQEEQGFVEGRIRDLEMLLSNVEIIQPGYHGDRIKIGSTVVIKEGPDDSSTFTIVGSAEADPVNGLISDESPIGQALIGLKAGDSTEVKTPSGVVKLWVLAIQ